MMEKKISFNALEGIEKIYRSSKDSQLSAVFFRESGQEINLLSSYLQLSPLEAVLFANAFVGWFDDRSFLEVFEHFGLTKFQVLKYRDAIEMLYSRNLLMNKRSRKKQIVSYDLSQNVINTVSKNEPVKFCEHQESESEKTLVDLLEEFDRMSEQFGEQIISVFDFREYIANICTENMDMPIFEEIKNYRLDNFETYFLLNVIWDAVSSGDNNFNTNVQPTIDEYFARKSQSLFVLKQFVSKETKLSRLNLIEISNENFTNKHYAKLSPKILDFLRTHHHLLISDVSKDYSKLLKSKDIPAKKLL